MKYWLLYLALLPCPLAMGQTVPPLPRLPESSMQPVMTTTAVNNAAGVRYQYQQVHLDGSCIWLAPAWRGQIKLEPSRKFLNYDAVGELDGLLLKTMNEMAAEGWELLQISSLSRPVEAEQKLEKSLQYNDPNLPVYKGTTSISTASETRYLFRRALP